MFSWAIVPLLDSPPDEPGGAGVADGYDVARVDAHRVIDGPIHPAPADDRRSVVLGPSVGTLFLLRSFIGRGPGELVAAGQADHVVAHPPRSHSLRGLCSHRRPGAAKA